MNDRELLEYAAKATGYEFIKYHVPKQDVNSKLSTVWAGEWVEVKKPEAPLGNCRWNPLTDDGDALRLAVKLHIGIMARSDFTMTWQYCKNNTDVTVEHKDNPESATRRAIVRAAAEIGKST